MKENFKLGFIFVGVLVASLVLAALIFFNFIQSKRNMHDVKIQSVKIFSSNFLPTISFDYPEFEDWETAISGNTILYHPGESIEVQFDEPPSIIVKNPFKFDLSAGWQDSANRNPQNVMYTDGGLHKETGKHHVTFYVEGFGVEILIPREEKYKNFSGEIIWEAIIKSFKPVAN